MDANIQIQAGELPLRFARPTVKSDFPEPGIRVVHCFMNLSGFADPCVGGLLTSNTILSRKVLGAESDPPGYVQPSIATIRLWKRRPAHAR